MLVDIGCLEREHSDCTAEELVPEALPALIP